MDDLNYRGPVGLAWFRRDDWPRWQELDPAIQGDYPAWRKRAEAAFTAKLRQGFTVQKVTIQLDQFLDWSRAEMNGHVNGEARTAYVGHLLSLTEQPGARH